MENNKFDFFKKKLLQMRSELAGEVEKSRQHSYEEVEGEVPDVNDDATRTISRQIILQLGENERKKLKDVDEALDMIDSNDYGICLECEEEIPMGRLELIPFTKHCVSCQENFENNHRDDNISHDNNNMNIV